MQTALPVRSIQPRITSSRLVVGSSGIEFGSLLFPTKVLGFKSGNPEIVVIGGRDKFSLVSKAFDNAGIKQILFVGWGSQGPAQAQNLRDTLKFVGSDIKVCVGLRGDSKSIPAAQAAGFNEANGTLGDPYKLAAESDLIICLVADGAMVEIHKQLFAAAKPGAIIGISHGFLVGHLHSLGETLPAARDFILVAPKGMGPSVRKLYLQGEKTEGAGINSSVAVQARSPERLTIVREVANAWSIGIGSPVTFSTTFMDEVISDLFGERAMLLGGLWGMTEALFDYFTAPDKHFGQLSAFRAASSGITGTVTELLSKNGPKGFYESLSPAQKNFFGRGYAIGYPVCDGVMDKIYGSVSSLREIGFVIAATKDLAEHPMVNIESGSPMWGFARQESLYGERITLNDDLVFSAGVYVGGLMAQLQTLLHHGHAVSEVVNESLIEAVDSLNPFMDAKGVAFMVDHCSITARLGTRLWGPVFKTRLLDVLCASGPSPEFIRSVMRTFHDEPLHHDIDLCMGCRPPVRIAVV